MFQTATTPWSVSRAYRVRRRKVSVLDLAGVTALVLAVAGVTLGAAAGARTPTAIVLFTGAAQYGMLAAAFFIASSLRARR